MLFITFKQHRGDFQSSYHRQKEETHHAQGPQKRFLHRFLALIAITVTSSSDVHYKEPIYHLVYSLYISLFTHSLLQKFINSSTFILCQ